jgi:hypothetical protein
MEILQEGDYQLAMFQLGKAVEAWEKKVVDADPQHTLPEGTNTMGAVAKFIKDENLATAKHVSILMGVVAVRNAADHSADPEINATWAISRETALATSHLTWALMRSVVAWKSGVYEL